jgi:hypothetical protein
MVGYGPIVTDLPAHHAQSEPSDPWWKLRAGWLYAAITSGELSDHDARTDVRYPVLRESIGILAVPGGRLVAADPYVMESDPEPFVQLLAADTGEVLAARAVIGEGHERVAALILKIGSEPVSDWVMATVRDQDVTALDDEGFFGYPVDAGTGSFGGPEAMKVVGHVLQADGGMLDDPVSKALFSDGIGTRSAVLVAPTAGATPVAVCCSGWGDGSYPTWLGVSDSGSVMVAVTDFLLTGDPYAAPLPPEQPAVAPAPSRRSRFFRRWFGA